MKFVPTFIIAALGIVALFVAGPFVSTQHLWIAGVFSVLLLLGIRSGLGEITSSNEKYFQIAILLVIGLSFIGLFYH